MEAATEVMVDDLGVNFSNMLQSSLTSTEGVDHPSSLHPHVSHLFFIYNHGIWDQWREVYVTALSVTVVDVF